MIIDIHAHTSNNELWELHTKSATLADLESMAKQFAVTTIVLMATYFPYKGRSLENSDLLERVKGNPLFKVFGSLDIMNNFADGLAELRTLAKNKSIAGIKLYPGYQDFHCSDKKIHPLYELAAEYELPVMFHGGELHGCCPYRDRQAGKYLCDICHIELLQDRSNPVEMAEAIKSFPQVKFIVSHLANPFFQELRQLMAECPNVYTDISGQFVSGRLSEDNPEYHQIILNELKQFIALPGGIDRLMFGTDFPIQSYQSSVNLVLALKLNEQEAEKVFYSNAARLLNL